jgi:hypothetical protein
MAGMDPRVRRKGSVLDLLPEQSMDQLAGSGSRSATEAGQAWQQANPMLRRGSNFGPSVATAPPAAASSPAASSTASTAIHHDVQFHAEKAMEGLKQLLPDNTLVSMHEAFFYQLLELSQHKTPTALTNEAATPCQPLDSNSKGVDCQEPVVPDNAAGAEEQKQEEDQPKQQVRR